MKSFKQAKNIKNQTGASVILFSAVLLFGITMTMIYSARVSVIEQKVTGNQVRAKEARQAGNSGLTTAMISINKADVDALITTVAMTQAEQILPGLGSYALTYNTLVAGDSENILVKVNAKSSDGSGRKSMQQVYKFMPFLSTTPPATLVSSGDVTLSDATVTLDNKSTTGTDATIWCARTIRKRGALGTSPAATTARTSSKLSLALQNKRIRSNVNANGTVLPPGNALFETFFSNTKKNMKKLATVVNCPTGCNSNDIDGLSGLVWVQGNLNMNSASVQGAGQWDSLTNTGNPIILVVDGIFKMNNPNSQINGLVYVTQNWDNTAGTGGKIKGGVIVEGDMTASGTLSLKYNSEILASITSNLGMYLPVAGTWTSI